jgi:hypothetical protein
MEDTIVRAALFQGIFHRHCGNGGAITKCCVTTFMDKVTAEQGAGTIMDKNDIRFRTKGVKACLHRILTPSAACNDLQIISGQIIFLEKESRGVNPVWWNNHHHLVDYGRVYKQANGVDKDGGSGKEMILFGMVQPHPASASGSRNYGSN